MCLRLLASHLYFPAIRQHKCLLIFNIQCLCNLHHFLKLKFCGVCPIRLQSSARLIFFLSQSSLIISDVVIFHLRQHSIIINHLIDKHKMSFQNFHNIKKAPCSCAVMLSSVVKPSISTVMPLSGLAAMCSHLP